MRVYRVRGLVDGSVEVLLYGKADDAAYVARCIALHHGAAVAKPHLEPKVPAFMYLVARGSAEKPLTVEIAKRLLKQHPKTGWVSKT